MFIDKTALLNQLTNFYKTYTYDNAPMDFLFQKYIEVAEYLENYILQIKDNLNIAMMETYRTFPYRTVSAISATYNYQDLLYNRNIIDKLLLNNKSLEERINIWMNLSSQDKANLLADNGYCIELSARRSWDIIEPSIVHMQVFDLQNNELVRGSDFLLTSNKLVFINSAAVPSVYNTKLILKNIKVDYNTMENKIGKNIGVPYSDVITKPEYRDFIQMLVYASLGGPTIKNIKSAFNTLAGWDNVEIVDMISATGYKKVFWQNEAGNAMLKPFDFIVSIPSSYFSNNDKISMFTKFLNIIKPSHTNFIIAWSEYTADALTRKNDDLGIKITHPEKVEQLNGFDDVTTRAVQHDEYTIQMQQAQTFPNIYDTDNPGMVFDNDLVYDLMDQMVDPGVEEGYGDLCDIRYITFPEIPLNFTASRDLLNGNVAITFKDNAQNISRYEILRNGIIILTAVGTGQGGTIKVTDTTLNGLPSGQYEYYARSVFEVNPDLPIQTQYSYSSNRVKITR
jgi:hypothetical protein